MDQRSQIKLSPNSWHAKLIKWTFGFDTGDFKNLCPYFWLLIASLIVCIPVTPFKLILRIFKLLVDRFNDYIDASIDSVIESLPRKLSNAEKYSLYARFGTDSKSKKKLSNARINMIANLTTKIRLATRDKLSLSDLFEQVFPTPPSLSELKKWEEDFDREVKRLEELEKIKEERLKKKYKKSKKKSEIIGEIVETTKFFVNILVSLGAVLIGYFLFAGITQLTTWICFRTFSEILDFFLVVLLIIIVTALLVGIIYGTIIVKEWWEDRERKTVLEWILLSPIFLAYLIFLGIKWLFYDILFMNIIAGIIEGLVQGFINYGGIFGNYLNASYSDYCPGIDWEKEDKK
jgi:hypothetical protein